MTQQSDTPHLHEPFRRLRRLVGDQGFEALQNCSVILFGVGGVGSWAAESLVRSGIGALTIVDSDEVALSNINRQMVALHSTVGKSKVAVLGERLLDINPKLTLTIESCFYTTDTQDQFDLDSYDYVLDAIDTLLPKKTLIEQASKSTATFFSSMGAALKTDPTRIKIAPIAKTKGCGLAKLIRKDMHRKGLKFKFMTVYSDELLENYYYAEDEKLDSTIVQKQVNGTVAHITVIFGNFLASMVINNCLEQLGALKKVR